MLKLKIQLDPKNAKQMLALSSFAAVLADVSDNQKQAIEGVAKLVNEDAPRIQALEKANAELKLFMEKETISAAGQLRKFAEKDLAPSGRTWEEQAWETANGNTEPVEEAPKRKRRTKAEIEAEKEASEKEVYDKISILGKLTEALNGESEEEDDAEEDEGTDAEEAEGDGADAEEVEETEGASGVTLDDIRRAVAEKKAVHLQIMKFKLKEGFSASKLDDLKPAQFAAFYKFVSGL